MSKRNVSVDILSLINICIGIIKSILYNWNMSADKSLFNSFKENAN